ncbi:hypothetical protein SNEBB_003556 [Seison nebaliae]|nr:hypothetical protein SNEBB_003556 [Seison nebaliae]
MPSMKFLGIKWRTGSDDFVFPAVADILYSFVCLIFIISFNLTIFKTVFHEHFPVRIYWCGASILFILIILIQFPIGILSANGSIYDKRATNVIGSLLIIRCILLFGQLSFNLIYGITVITQLWLEQNENYLYYIFSLLFIGSEGGAIILGILLLSFAVWSEAEDDVTHAKKFWQFRFSLLCCLFWKRNHLEKSIEEISELLAYYVHDSGLILSDVMVGILLLFDSDYLSNVEKKEEESFDDNQSILNNVNRPNWMNDEHLMKRLLMYANTVYGWPYYVFRHGICSPFSRTFLCTMNDFNDETLEKELVYYDECHGMTSEKELIKSKKFQSSLFNHPYCCCCCCCCCWRRSRRQNGKNDGLTINIQSSETSEQCLCNSLDNRKKICEDDHQQSTDPHHRQHKHIDEWNENEKSVEFNRIIQTRIIFLKRLAHLSISERYNFKAMLISLKEQMKEPDLHHPLITDYNTFNELHHDQVDKKEIFYVEKSENVKPCTIDEEHPMKNGDKEEIISSQPTSFIQGFSTSSRPIILQNSSQYQELNCHLIINDDVEMVQACLSNHIFSLPFIVCIDHSLNAIIISIRGTLSMSDALTDMTAVLKKFELPDGNETFLHSGMYTSANSILNQLSKSDIIESLLKSYLNYRLIVTGHSLGGGVAAILSTILHNKYPDIQCVTFGAPGGVFDRTGTLFTQSFTCSIVVEDDLVPRLSVKSMVDLRNRLIEVLKSCSKPKYRIFLQSFFNAIKYTLFGTRSSVLRHDDDGGDQSPTSFQSTNNNIDRSDQLGNMTMYGDQMNEQFPSNVNSTIQLIDDENNMPDVFIYDMFIPGGENVKYYYRNSSHLYEYQWRDYTSFSRIQLNSLRFFSDHLPHIYEKALFQ